MTGTPTPGRAPRALLILVVLGVLAASCTGGDPDGGPTTASPSASASHPPSAATKRCLAETAFLIDVASQVQRQILSVGGSTGDASLIEAAIEGSMNQRARLATRAMHGPRVADKARLDQGITDLIVGYEAVIAAGPRRKMLVIARDQVTKGADEVATVRANATVAHGSC